MQALQARLPDVYETFEDTWAFVEKETAEGDLLLAEADEAVDQLAAAQQHQARFLDELESSRECLDAACVDLKDASLRTTELKRKADDVQERSRSHRERCRRAAKDYVIAEEVLNNSLGCLATLVKDTASATHALSCGVPERDSNETKYLEEALEMFDDWQARCRSCESHDGPDTAEMVLVERAQQYTADEFLRASQTH